MKAYKIAQYGILTALAMVLSFLESLLPVYAAVPGVKLGLTNLVVMVALYRLRPADAFVINIIRIVLVGLTFGNAFSIVYSLAGGVMSFLVMRVLYSIGKKRSTAAGETSRDGDSYNGAFSPVGVGAAGGVAHNIGQLVVAAMVMRTMGVAYYLPVLIVSGVIAGLLVGMVSGLVVKHLPKKTVYNDPRL